MGWGSATDIFDGAVKVAIAFAPKIPEALVENGYSTPDVIIQSIVHEMYTKVEWDDWDTQDESEFFIPYLMEVMHDLDELDENEYAWRKAGCPEDWDWENKGW